MEEISRMRNPRHQRPTKAYIASLRGPDATDYAKLEAACLQAILTKKVDVVLVVSYLIKWPDDFPKGIIIKQEGLLDYRKVKAKRLLLWLNARGHSSITTEHIKAAGFSLTHSLKELDIL